MDKLYELLKRDDEHQHEWVLAPTELLPRGSGVWQCAGENCEYAGGYGELIRPMDDINLTNPGDKELRWLLERAGEKGYNVKISGGPKKYRAVVKRHGLAFDRNAYQAINTDLPTAVRDALMGRLEITNGD